MEISLTPLIEPHNPQLKYFKNLNWPIMVSDNTDSRH